MIPLHLAVIMFLALSLQQTYSTKEIEGHTTRSVLEVLNPLTQNEFDRSNTDHTTQKLLRVKRQYYPYYYGRPIPIPIIIGGGGWYGGRGFGGRGFGGRGFGGRGFGGRGFGGRGFGGFGGRGGFGGFGGGRGGRG